MTILLILYAIIIIFVACSDFVKVKSFDDFVLAGRSRGGGIVAASILASVIGASATMGVVQLAYSSGPAAFLWLGSGAVGLLVSGLVVSGKVRRSGAKTFAEAAVLFLGPAAARVASVIIVIAWVGIVAAQFIAAAKLVDVSTAAGYEVSLVLVSLLITGYCVVGGQLSVLKTDLVQFCVMAAGILMSVIFLFSKEWSFDIYSVSGNAEGLGITSIAYFMIVVGSGFVIGPDIFSRFFSASGPTAAKKAAFVSAGLLLVMSIGIVSIGLWVRKYGEMEPGGEAITWVLANILPGPLGVLMTLALLSAILSSADTCLVTASAIISRQFWKGGEVLPVRVLMLVLGTGAFATAWLKADIVKTLLLSYSVFNCGMIAPMLAAIMLYPRRKLAVRFVIPAIISGGTIGLWANFTDHKQMISIAAFGVSALLTAGAAMKGKKLQTGIFNDENR